MVILSDYFYKCRLSKKEYKVVSNPTDPSDNRFYPARSFEVFPVWLDYVSKNYPDANIVFFDNFSDIPFEEAMKECGVKEYGVIGHDSYDFNPEVKIHVKKFKDQFFYFHAVQRQRVEALKFAYLNNLDYFWLDGDYLVNNCVTDIIKDIDIFSPFINHKHQTIDAQFLYISKKRLHEWDGYFNIVDFLEDVLNNAPDERQSVRHHSLFEGGIYKMFCFGNYLEYNNLNMTHSACYNHFLEWLEMNLIDSAKYQDLLCLLKNIDKTKLTGALMEFHDVFKIKV